MINEFKFRRTWGPQPNYPLVQRYKRPPDWSLYFIAGPCSVESSNQIHEIARHVSGCGATHLRGGVFRAGTYPKSNFGYIPKEIIKAYQTSAHSFGLKNIIEILDYENDFDSILEYADCLQVGCRQMQNYTLLKKLSRVPHPVFLKRSPGSTIDEFLGAAEYLLESDMHREIILIERGSSTNATHVRWDLSISMIPAVKAITEIPILVDASHGTGRRDLVKAMTFAGIAAGADGCLIETHPNPEKSLSDSDQALSFDEYRDTMAGVFELINSNQKGVLK